MAIKETSSIYKLCFSLTHVWPLGGVVGLLLSLLGFEEIIKGQQLTSSMHAFRELGVDISTVTINYAIDLIPIAIIPMNIMIVAYGKHMLCINLAC
jgi:hypothetical protein